MHVPDGFINAPVSVAAGAVAAGAVAISLRGARRELDDRTAPLAGLVAAFVFAVQMLNFPVAAGTSGHLLGGALAAILVGPSTGVLCISVVLLMQSVLFADGGLTALGVNITTMGVVGVLVAYGIFRGLVKLLPRNRRSVTGAAFVAALVSVPAAAAAFTLLYGLGGTADVALGKVFAAMLGVHVLIGLGEAVITALTVGAVLSVRPDLVHGAHGLTAPLSLHVVAPVAPVVPGAARRTVAASRAADAAADVTDAADATDATDATPDSPAPAAPRPPRPVRPTRPVWLAGLAAALLCAGGLSYYASASPDGLERVAADHGIDEQAEEHGLAGSPLAGYGIEDITDARLSGGLAGVIGVGATLGIGSGVFLAVRSRRAAGVAPDEGRGGSGGTHGEAAEPRAPAAGQPPAAQPSAAERSAANPPAAGDGA